MQFEEGIEKTVRWHLDNEKWLENVTSVDYQKYYEKMYLSRKTFKHFVIKEGSVTNISIVKEHIHNALK